MKSREYYDMKNLFDWEQGEEEKKSIGIKTEGETE